MNPDDRWTQLLQGMGVAEVVAVLLSPLHRLRRARWAAEFATRD